MNLNINSNFDKMNDNLWTNKKPYQIVCIAFAFIIAIVIVAGPGILKYLGVIFDWIGKGFTFVYKLLKGIGYVGVLR